MTADTVPGTNRRGAATKGALRAAAASLIVEAGWGEASSRRVAERAGVLPGLAHYHFGSQQRLLVEGGRAALQPLVEGTREALADCDTIADGLARLVGVREHADDDYAATVLLAELNLAAVRDPMAAAALRSLIDDVRAPVRAWLARCGLEPDEADAAAGLLTAALDGIGLHRTVHSDVRVDRLELLGRVFAEAVR